jgi:hypothetical protein
MKLVAKVLVGCVSFVMTTGLYASVPEEILAPVEQVYVPNGFDDNDVTEVLVRGEFSSSCYQVGEGHYVINRELKEISVWVTAYKYEAGACAEVMTPYLKSIHIGVLEEGEYNVIVENAPTVKAIFSIEGRTSESPDDYLYAPVSGGNVELDANGRQYLNLMGTYPYTFTGCMVIKEVKFEYGANDVLVVLPIMETLPDAQCESYHHQFNEVYGLPQAIDGEKILHVRSINGHSYNRYLNFN